MTTKLTNEFNVSIPSEVSMSSDEEYKTPDADYGAPNFQSKQLTKYKLPNSPDSSNKPKVTSAKFKSPTVKCQILNKTPTKENKVKSPGETKSIFKNEHKEPPPNPFGSDTDSDQEDVNLSDLNNHQNNKNNQKEPPERPLNIQNQEINSNLNLKTQIKPTNPFGSDSEPEEENTVLALTPKIPKNVKKKLDTNPFLSDSDGDNVDAIQVGNDNVEATQVQVIKPIPKPRTRSLLTSDKSKNVSKDTLISVPKQQKTNSDDGNPFGSDSDSLENVPSDPLPSADPKHETYDKTKNPFEDEFKSEKVTSSKPQSVKTKMAPKPPKRPPISKSVRNNINNSGSANRPLSNSVRINRPNNNSSSTNLTTLKDKCNENVSKPMRPPGRPPVPKFKNLVKNSTYESNIKQSKSFSNSHEALNKIALYHNEIKPSTENLSNISSNFHRRAPDLPIGKPRENDSKINIADVKYKLDTLRLNKESVDKEIGEIAPYVASTDENNIHVDQKKLKKQMDILLVKQGEITMEQNKLNLQKELYDTCDKHAAVEYEIRKIQSKSIKNGEDDEILIDQLTTKLAKIVNQKASIEEQLTIAEYVRKDVKKEKKKKKGSKLLKMMTIKKK